MQRLFAPVALFMLLLTKVNPYGMLRRFLILSQ